MTIRMDSLRMDARPAGDAGPTLPGVRGRGSLPVAGR